MHHSIFYRRCSLALALSALLLSGCGGHAAPASAESSPPQQTISQTPISAGENAPASSLEEIYGSDYIDFVVETITMQMENRMDKNPERIYFPVRDQAALTDYVSIDAATEFYIREDGNPVVVLPAGTVTDEVGGKQEFILPKP